MPHPRVEDEVAVLRAEVAQLTQELLMHRKVLEQCLEVRESVMELLELREGLQRIANEIGDRTAELDLSLAGVSDNTARHGKAISTLSEQQKRTTATLDAVVRAVKRLDRSRSRHKEIDFRAGSTGGSRPGEGYQDFARWMGHGIDTEEAATISDSHKVPGELQAFDPRMSDDADAAWDWPGVNSRSGSFGKAPPGRTFANSAGPAAGPAMAAGAEMANCVKGVLARIEEALTKLDGPSGQDDYVGSVALGPDGSEGPGSQFLTGRGAYPNDAWACSAPGSRPCSARAQSSRRPAARTPRGKTATVANPKVHAGTTPRGNRPVDAGSWRVADSWA